MKNIPNFSKRENSWKVRRIIFLLVLVACFVSCGSEGNISELQEQNKQLEKEKLLKNDPREYIVVNEYGQIIFEGNLVKVEEFINYNKIVIK